MTRQLKQEELYRIEEIYEEMVELLREANRIVQDTSQGDYWHAYVPGNIFAGEFGYLGKSGGDYMKEVIDHLREEAEREDLPLGMPTSEI